MSSSNAEIYAKVAATIDEALASGVVPWRRPWKSGVNQFDGSLMHANLQSKKPYRGINVILLGLSAAANGFSSPYWLSRKQIKARGGSWSGPGTMIVWWKILRVRSDKSDEIDSKTGKPKLKTIPMLKHYYVWSLDQCTGIEAPEAPAEPVSQFNPIERAQIVIDQMPDRPVTRHGGDRAVYFPTRDEVHLPHREQFNTPQDYYSTAYHEYAHSTGHEKRLGRVKDWTEFGSDPYAREELVAELCAAMLCGTVGINVTYEQSASYIQSWRQRLQDDPRLLVSAAGQAQRAADFICGKRFEAEAEAEAEAEKEFTEQELSHA